MNSDSDTKHDKRACLEDSMGLLKLLDDLHLARMFPQGSTNHGNTGETESAEAEGTSPFPDAKRIVESSNGLFRDVQRQLRLLQTVIHIGGVSGATTPFVNLAESPTDIHVPWLSPETTKQGHLTGERCKKSEFIHQIFIANRQRGKLAEFAALFDAPMSADLTSEENAARFLLVSDQELSLHSLLLVLAFALGDVSSSGDDPLHLLNPWFEGECSLHGELFHDVEVAAMSFHGKTKCENDRTFTWSGLSNYWTREVVFTRAMEALGFWLGTRPTDRWTRLLQWLRAKQHHRHDGIKDSNLATTGDDDLLITGAEHAAGLGASLGALQDFCRVLVRAKWGANITAPNTGSSTLHTEAAGICELACRRCNLPGEYLLRKDESADRSYFASPLAFFATEEGDSRRVAAFALGTVLGMSSIDEGTLPRVRKIRALLRALAQFGLDQAVRKLAMEHAAQTIRSGFAHQTSRTIRLIIDDVNEVREQIGEPADEIIACLSLVKASLSSYGSVGDCSDTRQFNYPWKPGDSPMETYQNLSLRIAIARADVSTEHVMHDLGASHIRNYVGSDAFKALRALCLEEPQYLLDPQIVTAINEQLKMERWAVLLILSMSQAIYHTLRARVFDGCDDRVVVKVEGDSCDSFSCTIVNPLVKHDGNVPRAPKDVSDLAELARRFNRESAVYFTVDGPRKDRWDQVWKVIVTGERRGILVV